MKDLSLKNFKKLKKSLKKAKKTILKKNSSEELITSFKLINDTFLAIVNTGQIITKNGVSEEEFLRIAKCKTLDQLNDILDDIYNKTNPKEKQDKHISKLLSKSADTLALSGDFEYTDDSFYLKGIPRTLPKLLVAKFTEVILEELENHPKNVQKHLEHNEEYQSLKRFFMWCCLNPRAEVANQLYDFLMNNSFRITKQGFFVALRNVVSLQQENGDNELVSFISNAYNKIKAVWKKNPKSFRVVTIPGSKKYELKQSMFNVEGTEYVCLGDLEYLYLNLPNMRENRFTDDYTKTFDIRVGRIVSMPMEKCSWSTRDCAEAGLHFTSDQIHYVGCGDTSVITIINPMKVVGIGTSKGRCYEYLPIMTVPRDEATSILHDLDFDTLELDELYAINELEDLQVKVREGFVAESKKHSFNLPQISSAHVDRIVKSLNKMKETIKGRVIKN